MCSKNIAGVTQLVECNLAKVDVESSNLFARSRFCPGGVMVATLALGASAERRVSSSLT